MEQKPKSTGTAIAVIDSLEHEKIADLARDVAEIALDEILSNDALKEIPVFKWVAALHGLGMSIRDRIFLQKMLNFLEGVSTASPEERRKFTEKLSENTGSREKAGLLLTSQIERLDAVEKASVLSRIYLACIYDTILYEDFCRYAMILDRCFLPDIDALKKLQAGERVDEIAAPLLSSLGLVYKTQENFGTIDGIGGESWYEVSELGKKFLAAAFYEAHHDRRI